MIRQPVRIFLKDSFHCLYRPGTLPHVSARSAESEFSASRFWSRAKFGCGNELRDNLGRLSALSCGHRQDIPPVFSASASSANDPRGFRVADSFGNVWGTFRKAGGQCRRHWVLTTIQHVTDPAVGNRPDRQEAMQKQCRSHAEVTKPCGFLTETTEVLGKCRIGVGDGAECGALRTYVRQNAKSSVKNVYFITFVTNDNP